MARSELIVDLGAVRRNVRTLLAAVEGAEVWAVVKADGYGHGAADVGGAALGAGATALCVATVPEALRLRDELGRLLGEESAWVDAHRLEAVRRTANRFGCVCLLKGSDTLVAAPGHGVLVCGPAPASLATAGTGDVLTGVLVAYLAKGLEPRLAAAAAATATAEAARLVPHARGVTAGDVVAALPHVHG